MIKFASLKSKQFKLHLTRLHRNLTLEGKKKSELNIRL